MVSYIRMKFDKYDRSDSQNHYNLIPEMIQFCENFSGLVKNWNISSYDYNGATYWIFKFDSEEDALVFKLRFGKDYSEMVE